MRNSCNYSIAGTNTFRLSSRKLFNHWGGNLQNIEKSVRQIYIPDDGKIFVQVDQAGAEALIVAYCGIAGKYRELFRNKVKPHTYLAMRLFKHVWPLKMMENHLISSYDDFDIDEMVNTPIAELRKHPHWQNLSKLIKDSDDWSLTERYYYLAKQTEHSSNYDVGAPAFRMNILTKSGGKIVISQEDAVEYLGIKHALYPEIKGSYHRYVEKCARDTGYLYNLLGHPLAVTDQEITPSILKELYAVIPQSTVGEITNMAYVKLYEYIVSNKLKWDVLANTHDSYLCQCPIGEEQECGRVMQEFINVKLVSPIDGVEFNMESEAQCGYNWMPAKKSNPNGLKPL